MSDVYYEDMSDDFLAERTTGWFKEANERALQARRLVSLLGELAVRLNNPSRLLFYARLIRSWLTRKLVMTNHTRTQLVIIIKALCRNRAVFG